VTVLAVAMLPRLPSVVRLLAEDGLPPFVLLLRCGDDAVDVVDFDVDVDGKDKDGDADSVAEAYVALFRRFCFEDAADAAKEPREPVNESPPSSSSPCSLTASKAKSSSRSLCLTASKSKSNSSFMMALALEYNKHTTRVGRMLNEYTSTVWSLARCSKNAGQQSCCCCRFCVVLLGSRLVLVGCWWLIAVVF
jgi:hypothetical protein